MSSITRPARKGSTTNRAADTPTTIRVLPTTARAPSEAKICRDSMSEVSLETSTPVLVLPKKAMSILSTWAYILVRRSIMNLSPIQATV